MGIQTIDVIEPNEISKVDMTVSVENLLDIRVSAGSFRVSGVDYVLESDSVETIDVDPTYETIVKGFLAYNNSTDTVEVLVDEFVLDEIDVPYDFSDGSYKLLEYLYKIRVPAGTTDLSTLDLIVRRIIKGGE